MIYKAKKSSTVSFNKTSSKLSGSILSQTTLWYNREKSLVSIFDVTSKCKNSTFKTNLNALPKSNMTYTSYSKLSEVKLLTIGIASPLRILQWAEKTLPNGKIYGEVLNANTLHHKTFKPQKGGLFCERIFGPLKDFECACGKLDKTVKQEFSNSLLKSSTNNSFLQSDTSEGNAFDEKQNNTVKTAENQKLTQNNIFSALSLKNENKLLESSSNQNNQLNIPIRKFCPVCDVEYTWSVIRRYQLGYIKLISPVTHLWFLKGTPSYLSLLLDIKKRHLQFVTYCSETLTLENSLSQNTKGILMDSPTKIFDSWKTIMENRSETYSEMGEVDKNKKESSFKQSTNPQQFKKAKRILKEAISNKEWKQNQIALNLLTHVDELKDSKNFNLSLLNSSQTELGSVFFFSDLSASSGSSALQTSSISFDEGFFTEGLNQNETTKNIQLSFMSEKNKNFFVNNLESSPVSLKNENDRFSTSFNEYFNSISLNKVISLNETSDEQNNTETKKTSKMKDILVSSLNQMLNEKNQTKDIKFEIKNSENLKESFNLTKVLNVLQVSVYYNSIFLNSLNSYNYDSNIISSRFNESTLNNQMILNFTNSKNNTKLNATLYKIYQKLPVQNYILCSLEQKIQKKALILAVKNTWDSVYNKAYMSALKKVKKIKLKYTTNENLFLPIAPVIQNNSHLQPKSFSVVKKSEKFLPILNQSKNMQKLMVYKLGENLLSKILEKLQKKYSDYVLTILKKNKHPILSANYTTLINNYTHQTVFTVAKDIEKVLINETDWITNVLTQSLFKYLLFGQYLENMNFLNANDKNHLVLNSNTLTNSSTSMFLDYYSNYFSNKKLETKSTLFSSEITTKPRKIYPLENPLLLKKKSTKDDKYYKENQKIFNTVYTLSHRERWETEKDWYIFTLFNSASIEYLDTPIAAYKKRLFSYSFDFVHETEAMLSSSVGSEAFFNTSRTKNSMLRTVGTGTQHMNDTNKISANFQEVLYSSSFYSGPGIVKQLVNEFDFTEIKKLDKQNRLLLYQLNKSIFKLKKQVQVFVYDKIAKNELKELCKKRDLLIRRTKLVRKLFRKDSNPSSMILTILPVLPPDLRPIVKMGGQIAASDLNRLYQRVIYRNERLKKFLKDPATSQSYEMKYAQRLLQESVDNLIQNGKSGINSEKDARGRALKSLSDSLKGKQGRFRQFLLGKRVDYSGRSVIVVGPKLKLHECGLPIEMAKELYLPFLLKMILNKNYAKTVIGAKALIKKNPALTSELLREIMQVSPVLLNRAPTLHRLGFQAFVPKLIEGRAILLHPLVCSAFNADFDGDQMAVHVPITIEARAEAWKLMLSKNNILSPATGEPLAIPSQDMVLGCYYLTTYTNKGTIPLLKGSGVFFNNFEDVIRAYNQQKIHVHAFIWVKWTGLIENGSDQEEPLEIRLTSDGLWQEISANYYRIYDSNNHLVTQYVATTPGRVLFNLYLTRNMN